MVTIVICYKIGTGGILATNLASLARHTKDVNHNIVVLVAKGDIDEDLISLGSFYRINIKEVDLELGYPVSNRHGAMLDQYIPSEIKTEYVMTLDSDCFPVADGWLSELLNMNADLSGILHPWSPPDPSMNTKKIEWRVRTQHCWESTHVACQLIKTYRLRELSAKYNAGDDTGLDIVAKAKLKGFKIDGFRVTRCPIPSLGKTDPELNRYVGLVFGDYVFHYGGFTRKVMGDEQVLNDEFGWIKDRMIANKGVEFLLDEGTSYKFTLDREEEVSKYRMDRLFGMRNA